ncbi:RNA polymerase factor sigma-54 [Pararhodobacter sp.]|uniref:RNA polymerase factor sigma-54 n=1 Tax=Pararhodobacter sp. TaxID=2127056 RepID=UPI002B00095A|nr:RNA polymerase factor sigma-54 [Pararhodobacter sp.]
MVLKNRLELRLQQRLALTPTLRTRLSILRMGPLDLAEEIAREAARNPFLRHEPPSRMSAAEALPEADLAAPDLGFQEDLRRQLALKPLSPMIAALAEFLVGELREDGFLDVELRILAAEIVQPEALLEQALEVLQSCEPPGIGARTLPECLQLQLVAKGLDAGDAAATVWQLPAFAKRDWPVLKATLGLDENALRARANLLRGLSPRPVPERPLSEAAPLRPDLRLERYSDGQFAIVPHMSARPTVMLDMAMVRRAETEGFAPDLLLRAKTLIDAVDQRGATLARIGEWLVRAQGMFFLQGPEGLVPASRADLAAELDLHPSTISRAVSGKAIDVDGRLWPLAMFFSSALSGPHGMISSRAVKKRISDLIAAEVKAKPLSDETLVEKLSAEGIDIARRTVAKYRQGLRIPSSSARRKLAHARGTEKPGG